VVKPEVSPLETDGRLPIDKYSERVVYRDDRESVDYGIVFLSEYNNDIDQD
jgi:hypothetical protein